MFRIPNSPVVAVLLFAVCAAAPVHASAPAAAPASKPAAAARPAAHTRHSPQFTRASATIALAHLMNGNERFAGGRTEHPRQGAAVRRELAAGQHPRAIVLSCADSRVPPEIVFDQGLGDLFVVRVAGNTLDAATVASIEYAVEHLEAPLIVVLGHHACGAVKAALTTEPKAAGSPDLERLLQTIGPAVRPYAAESAKSPTLDRAVRANVDASLLGLRRRSAIVRERADAGLLTLVPALYRLEDGRVEFWDAVEPQAGAAH
jgi:carbonic anhydrase